MITTASPPRTSATSSFSAALAMMLRIDPVHRHTTSGVLTRRQATSIAAALDAHSLLRDTPEVTRDLIRSVDWDAPTGLVESREIVLVLDHAGALR